MRIGSAGFKHKQTGRVDVPTATLCARFARISYLSQAEVESELARRVDPAEVRFFGNPNIDTSGFIADYDDFSVLTFRGTDTIRDWFGNIQITKKQFDFAPGLIHNGFGTALEMTWVSIESAIAPVKAEIKSGERSLWIVGHSLGGALAVLCAARLRSIGVPVSGICTFGQPMVGNSSFANSIVSKIGRAETLIKPAEYWRVVNNRDIVPRLPAHFSAGAYRHSGRFYWLRGSGNTRQNVSGQAIYESQIRPYAAIKALNSLPPRNIEGTPDEIADHRIEAYCDELELLLGMGA